ncbi:MAG: YigZ family protein [Spirochaetota bacterium]
MNHTEKGAAVYIPAEAAQTEIEIKKSRFIAIARAAESAEHAKEEVKTAWREHPQASHIVYAYQIGKRGDLFGLSDDGEPHGTAGRPVLEVIKGSGITNLLIMVVRYFGGTKLGTGGLVKAYTEASQKVLTHLRIEELIDKYGFRLQVPYSLYEPVRMLLSDHQASLEHEEFLTEVQLAGTLPQSEADAVQNQLRELSAGKLTAEFEPV